jgi:hypothetical protein
LGAAAQAEAIATLKGASSEHKHVRECYAVHRFDVGYHHYIWAKFQVTDQGHGNALNTASPSPALLYDCLAPTFGG